MDTSRFRRLLTAVFSTLLLSGLPAFSQTLTPFDLKDYDHLDPQNIVPDKPLKQALTYLENYKDRFPNQNYLIVIDFTKNSSKKRLFLIDLKSGAVTALHTAHGKGSDADGDGLATKFSNASGSKATSLGFYRTAEVYSGDHGKSLRLDGLSPTNSNARSRAIVLHPADYVSEKSNRAGRSWGCPAVDPKVSSALIDKIKKGALLYAWAGQ